MSKIYLPGPSGYFGISTTTWGTHQGICQGTSSRRGLILWTGMLTTSIPISRIFTNTLGHQVPML